MRNKLQKGQGLLEYAIILVLALVVIVIIGALVRTFVWTSNQALTQVGGFAIGLLFGWLIWGRRSRGG